MIVRGQKYDVFFAGAPMLVPVSGVVMVVGTKCAPADGRTASPAAAAAAAAITKLFEFILETSVSVLSNERRASAPDQQINKQLQFLSKAKNSSMSHSSRRVFTTSAGLRLMRLKWLADSAGCPAFRVGRVGRWLNL
jgi:hypothetical protein